MQSLEQKYFSSLVGREQHISDMVKYRNELNEQATSICGVDTTKERVQTSHMTDKICDITTEIATLDQKIEDEKNILWDALEECRKRIYSLHNADYFKVLSKVYMQFKSYKQAAQETGHSYAWVKKKHGEAVAVFGKENYEFLNEWGLRSMNNAEHVEQLMNQLFETQQKKQQLQEQEIELTAAVLDEMQKNQVERLENAKIKINFVDRCTRRTVNVKRLKELYPEAFRDCIKQSEVAAHISVEVLT